MINNQDGFLEAPGFVLLLMLSLLLVTQIVVWQKRVSQTREHHLQVLCLKRSIGISQQMIKRINSLNLMLASGKVGQGIAILFPGSGWLLALKWEKVKKILMGLQETAFLWAQKEWLSLRVEGCQLPLKWQRSPYQYNGRLKREMDLVQLRTTQESYRWKTPYVSYLIQWSIESATTPHASWRMQ